MPPRGTGGGGRGGGGGAPPVDVDDRNFDPDDPVLEGGDEVGDGDVLYDDDVEEIDAATAKRGLERGGKGTVRIPWSEARLLSLLQTASSCHYATIRFNGENITHGKKGAAMNNIRVALGSDPSLWPHVPLNKTLDAWIDAAVAGYIQVCTLFYCTLPLRASSHILLPDPHFLVGAWQEGQQGQHG